LSLAGGFRRLASSSWLSDPPFEFDLKLDLIAINLDLELRAHAVGNVDADRVWRERELGVTPVGERIREL